MAGRTARGLAAPAEPDNEAVPGDDLDPGRVQHRRDRGRARPEPRRGAAAPALRQEEPAPAAGIREGRAMTRRGRKFRGSDGPDGGDLDALLSDMWEGGIRAVAGTLDLEAGKAALLAS